jgi:hypothetical protein
MPTDVAQPTQLLDDQLQLTAPSVLIGDPTTDGGMDMLDVGRIPSATITTNPSKVMGSKTGPQQLAGHVYDRGVDPEVTLTLQAGHGRVIAAMLSPAIIPDFKKSVQAVSTSSDSVTVSGDVSPLVESGDVVTVNKSTGNDGSYVLTGVSYDSTNDETTLTFESGDIGNSTADGGVIGFQEGNLFKTGIQSADVPTLCVVPQSRRQHAIDQAGVYWCPAVTTTDIGDWMWEDSEGESEQNEYDVAFSPLYTRQDQAGNKIQKGARRMFSVPPWKLPGTPLDWHLPEPYDTQSAVAISL